MDTQSPYAKKISKRFRAKEKLIKYFFFLNGFVTVLLILLIFLFLLKESFAGYTDFNLSEYFFTEKTLADGSTEKIFEWFPTSEDQRLSIVPLILGTLLTAIPATIISTMLGVFVGIYLSEIAGSRLREILKPIIELFAGIPTVVLGFFMLVVGATYFQDVFFTTSRLNAILAAVGLSFIIIPIIATLTEEALRSIPLELRMASYSLGATKWQTISRVIIPTAVSGISAGIILGFGRAVGETMIVLMASGNAAELTLDVFRSVRTMTATIAAELGEVSAGSQHYFALFFIGTVLFIGTFLLNLIAELIINKMRKKIRF
ncbi:MAG: phosphate ABC transporter permease subunit PstC [Melioribacteraceae bacterium]|nr:phosphate ABC transporter permease subunit PstC [Melioribacteraceae bacterium]MCF8353338.1 phosphate ABC transporter permease subunit PstC [Melioribacteraceae bacterium]MCF8393202.1 phosphate ABC transporter permease subunit PstC [Melioribacteraceae bacterium]MCF8419064.1 phosphate ABC transporter permease subunit PstC [Melioribacteraceae bacterium]